MQTENKANQEQKLGSNWSKWLFQRIYSQKKICGRGLRSKIIKIKPQLKFYNFQNVSLYLLGDGLLSRDEFENGPWDLDATDLEDVEAMDDLMDENEDLIDKEFIDYDSESFNDILEGDEGMEDEDNEIVDDIEDMKEDFEEDRHERTDINGENDVKEKVEEVVNDLQENIKDVRENVKDINQNVFEKIGDSKK